MGAFSNSLKLADQFERPPVATGKGLVEFGPCYLGPLHLRGDITDDFSGNTDHEFSRGNFSIIGDHTPLTDDAIFSHFHPFVKDSPHSDENVLSDLTTMHDGTMTDVAIFREPGGLLGKGMDDGIFLNVGTVADFDITKISP